MVYKRGKKIELRKRKDTDKEQKSKARKKKKKEIKEYFQSSLLSVTIFLLIGANLVFIISIVIHSFSKKGTTGAAFNPSSYQVVRPEKPKKKLKVEVLNGCGVPGVAKEITDYLRKKDIDVVYYGNFESWNLSETLVIDRRDHNLSHAKVIGEIIGVKENRMFPQSSPQRQLDVTIIIGRNYSELKAFK